MKFAFWKCPNGDSVSLTPEEAPVCAECGTPLVEVTDIDEIAEMDRTFKQKMGPIFGMTRKDRHDEAELEKDRPIAKAIGRVLDRDVFENVSSRIKTTNAMIRLATELMNVRDRNTYRIHEAAARLEATGELSAHNLWFVTAAVWDLDPPGAR
jgi:hypothetical protein